MPGLQLFTPAGIAVAATLSVRLLFWAVRGDIENPATPRYMLGYMGGSFFLAMCFVGTGAVINSLTVAGSGILVLMSGMFGIIHAVIEAIIDRGKGNIAAD